MNERWMSVRVKGDFALFTRPENKVERVTYPVITPSAARGVLEAIFWHPQFTWVIKEIHVLNEVRTFSILRNEVNSKMSPSRAEPYYADEDRSQRHSVCLRDVDYVIYAEVAIKSGQSDHPQKYREQFQRRVERGQCFHRPSLGCREFAAEVEPWDRSKEPAKWTEDLGLMLWDLQYPSGRHDETGWRPSSKAPYWPSFFSARVEQGVLRIPATPIGSGN